MLPICGVTAALGVKSVAVLNPQCDQSTLPSVVSCTVPVGVAKEPFNTPPLAGALIVRVTGTLCERAPLGAVMFKEYVPGVTLDAVLRDRAAEPLPSTAAGMNTAPTPAGNPLID